MTTKLDIHLKLVEKEQIVAGIKLYVKHLAALAKEAEKLGKTSDQERYDVEGTALDQLVQGGADRLELYSHHQPAVKKGLEFLKKNMLAAKGTVIGVAKHHWAEELEMDAEILATDLLPKFDEQASLSLEQPVA
jgi:hypothetical protein